MSSKSDWLKKKLAECPEYKETLRATQRKYRATHKKERRDYERNKRATDPVYREKQETRERNWKRAKSYMDLYGITVDDYDRMFEAQDRRCAVCRKASEKRLAVDHCHRTGKVRWLLCNGCNSMLAFAGDDPDLLEAGATVVREFNRQNPIEMLPAPPIAPEHPVPLETLAADGGADASPSQSAQDRGSRHSSAAPKRRKNP